MQVRLGQQEPDVVLLDLSLPDRHGVESYKDLRTLSPTIPIIILTGLDDETAAAEAVRAGAQDYLVKSQFDGRILMRIIRHAIERKRIEKALRESEEFFRLISENVTDLIAVVDEKGRRLYNSPSYRNVLGDPEKLVGTDSFDEIHPEDRQRVKQVFRESLASGAGRRIEYRFLLQDGSVREVESQGSVVRDDTGRPSRLVVVSRDITDQKGATRALRSALADLKASHDELRATQQRLIEAERLEAISTFAAGVAHEVRNPLQGITLSIDYLSSCAPPEDADAAGVLERMRSGVDRINDVIAGLTEFAVRREPQPKHEDLNAIVERALKSVENELKNHPIQLRLGLGENLPSLELDSTSLRHVLITLLMSSVRAISTGGVLSVRTYTRHAEVAAASHAPPNGPSVPARSFVVTEIAHRKNAATAHPDDHGGAGRRSSHAPKTGLGLGILRKIVSAQGGTIEHAKEKQWTSKYTIEFPLDTRHSTHNTLSP
jgi:PAS domain S-box-containing protein